MNIYKFITSTLLAQGLASLLASSPSMATPVFTSFQPAIHGFKFTNDFNNRVELPGGADIRTSGLCGGMSYAAVDYFYAERSVPQQNWRPQDGRTLQAYFYDRQTTSLISNLDKWSEVIFNPLGIRNSEFFKWGLQGSNGGRLEELRTLIDQGRPALLGLKGANGSGNHQVVAYGYDLGRYKGDLGVHQGDFKIYVLDPNFPNESRTLVPNLAKEYYYYLENPEKNYQTYFVDKNYAPQNPPAQEDIFPYDGRVYKIILEFATGDDDLRGGSDNIHATVFLHNGQALNFNNINLGKRWMSNYNQFAELTIPSGADPENLALIRVTMTDGSDNWDMKSVTATGVTAKSRVHIGAGPAHRFTGNDRTIDFRVSMGSQFEFSANNFQSNSGVDLRGTYSRLKFPLARTSYTECQAACAFDSACVGYTYAPIGTYSPTHAMCSLKSSVSSALRVSNSGMVSGIKNDSDVSIELSVDRGGADYNHIRGLDLKACTYACSNDTACVAYTFVRPGLQGSTSVCYLKNRAQKMTAVEEGLVSGVRTRLKSNSSVTFEVGFDRPGSDYSQTFVSTYDQCARKCADDSICRAYTFVAPHHGNPGSCFLKHSEPNSIPSAPEMVSGRKFSKPSPLY